MAGCTGVVVDGHDKNPVPTSVGFPTVYDKSPTLLTEVGTMKIFLVLTFSLFGALAVQAQSTLEFRVVDSSSRMALVAVTVRADNGPSKVTDSMGRTSFMLPDGKHRFQISSIGYRSRQVEVLLPHSQPLTLALLAQEDKLEDVTIVASTRSQQRIENAPLKVEVLGKEETDEESTIKPANIASLLSDVSGVQIQQSSVVSGNANVRIQGLEGRYTQILRDGLPLFEGFSGGFGILSIPPLDLRQVELIKGSASTLYGGGAIGGLINLISRRPTGKQEGVMILNQSTLRETNGNFYFAKRYRAFGYTLFGGYSRQKEVDVNTDGFSDVPRLHAIVVHPRLFFYPDENTTIITGYTGSFEDRRGGDMLAIEGKGNAQHPYFERNRNGRHSGEWVLERRLSGGKRLELKGSLSGFDRKIRTNTHYFHGQQANYYSEASLLVPYGRNSFVGGINAVGDRFRLKPSDPVDLAPFRNSTFGAFVQNTWQAGTSTTVEAGLRNDYHTQYGNFLLPRLALFQRIDEHWAARAGIGLGYKTPNPLTPQVVDAPIEKIQRLTGNVHPERSVGYNLEVNYKTRWDEENELFVNHAFFLTRIGAPIVPTEDVSGRIFFANAGRPLVSKGFDTYVRAKLDEWELYAGYTFTVAERTYLDRNIFVPLTPKHRAAFTLVREWEEPGWRLGLEGSYTGPQYRFSGSRTPGYVFMAAMVEKRFGKVWSVVLNGENLLDYRQSKVEALFTGSVAQPEFLPLWAPIDGRVVNMAVKVNLFAGD